MLVFVGRERYAENVCAILREGDPFDLGVSARLVAKCWVVFGDAILVHRKLSPHAERNINQPIAKVLVNSVIVELQSIAKCSRSLGRIPHYTSK